MLGGVAYAFYRFFLYRRSLGPFPVEWRKELKNRVAFYRRLDRAQRREFETRAIENNRSDIDDYALTNEAEFLSVASEYFFQRPEKFAEGHPELYELMSSMFQQDPAAEEE